MLILKDNKILFFFVLFVILTSLIRVFQGIDFTDTGYLISHYKIIFSDIKTINILDYSLLGTFLIGGFFYNFLGFKTLVSFKILYLLTSLITAIFSYYFLKKFLNVNKKLLIIFLLLTFFFLNFFHQNYLDYDNLSINFLILILIFCTNIYQKENYHISSFLLAFFLLSSIFINFKNLSFIFNIFLIFFFLIYEKKFDKKYLYLNFFSFLLGLILSLIVIFHTLNSLDISAKYFDFLKNIFLIDFIDSSDVHSFSYLIKRHFRDYSIVIIFLTIFIFFHNKALKKVKFDDLIIISSTFFIILFFLEIFILDFKRWYLPGFFAYIIFLSLLEKKESRIFYLFIFINIFLISAGSAGSVEKSSYIYWLTIPTTFNYFLNLKYNNHFLNIFRHHKKYYLNILLCYLLIYACLGNYLNTYRDSYNFLKLSHQTNFKELRYSFTTKERANSINSLHDYLIKNNFKNNEVISFNSIPMLFFITELKPHRKIWNFTSSVNSLENFFLNKNFSSFPDIIYAKTDMMNKSWPEKGDIKDIKTEMYDKKILVMKKFIKKYDYKIKWQNDSFVIMSKK